jgi:phosphoserine phosphatase
MSNKLAFFDLDGTLTSEHSVWEFIHKVLGTWSGKGEVHLRDWLDGRIDYGEFARVDAAEWKGVHIDEIRRIAAGIPVLPGAREAVDFLKSKGCRVIILSSGLDVLAGRIADELGISDHFSNKLLTGPEGYLTGEVQISVPAERPGEHLSNGKGAVLTKIQKDSGFSIGDTMAIGDSESDIPMFRYARVSFAVNHANEVTQQAATHYAKDLFELKEQLESILI